MSEAILCHCSVEDEGCGFKHVGRRDVDVGIAAGCTKGVDLGICFKFHRCLIQNSVGSTHQFLQTTLNAGQFSSRELSKIKDDGIS